MITVKVTGVTELLAAFRALPRAVGPKETAAAAEEAMAEIAEDMISRAPRLTGRGAESIRVATVSTVDGQALVAVGPDEQAFLESGLGFAEFGTRHQPARPWMRPAWDVGKARAQHTLGASLWQRIAGAARSLGRG